MTNCKKCGNNEKHISHSPEVVGWHAFQQRAHIVAGQFQSDKYPTCPPGKVPLFVKDPAAQPLLWEYAQQRRSVDVEFADDLEFALREAGYEPKPSQREAELEAELDECESEAGDTIEKLKQERDAAIARAERADEERCALLNEIPVRGNETQLAALIRVIRERNELRVQIGLTGETEKLKARETPEAAHERGWCLATRMSQHHTYPGYQPPQEAPAETSRCTTCDGSRFVEVGPNYLGPCPGCINTDGCLCRQLATGEASFCGVHSCGVASAITNGTTGRVTNI